MPRKKAEATADPVEDRNGPVPDDAVDESIEPKTIGSSAMRRIQVMIRGLPPGLLMCSKGGMDVDGESSGKKRTKQRSPEEEADLAAYWIDHGNGTRELGLPWINLYRSIVGGAKRFRYRGQESMRTVVASSIACTIDMIPLGTDQYVIDSRWGKIPPRTGGTVMLNRALLLEWSATFTMVVDDELYKVETLRDVISMAGKMNGVCAFRPSSPEPGPYGKYVVEEWTVLE